MKTRRLVVASGNAGKILEIRAALAALPLKLIPQAQLGIAGAAEPHPTFLENALAKARHAAASAKLPALADDSGLVVPALGGAPGVLSARYAGAKANDAQNNKKLLAAMRGRQNRSAFYYALMVFVREANDPFPLVAEGFWRGNIARAPAGDSGFGYDPIFVCDKNGKTGAQLTPAQKNRVSHRGQSLRQLARLMQARL